MQILARSTGCKEFQFQAQLVTEIITYVADDFLLCSRCKAGNRDRMVQIFPILQLSDEVADIHIVHAEILSPGREAMRLINYKADDISGIQQFLDGFGTQRLRRDIENRSHAVGHTVDGLFPFDGVQKSVDRHGIRNAALLQIIHLILHQ